MSWRVLDFTEFEGKLRYVRGHVHAEYPSGKTKEVNLREIALVIAATHVSISSGLLLKLGELGIPLMITDWKYVPVSSLHSWSAHTRVGARQMSQASCSLPRRKSAWQALIRAKILGQAQTLNSLSLNSAAEDLKAMSREVRSGDPTNMEAQAARYYWSKLFGTLEFQRNQDSDDFLNSALNYGYTILRGHGIRAVAEAGLWPAIGVFHRSRSNAFNLVDDLIEPFRPVVDWVVTQFSVDADMRDPKIRKALVECLKLQYTNDGYSTSTVLSELSKAYGIYVEGETSRLIVPAWSGPRLNTDES
ncbi:type II CRISPR-associated endonuclease Cas1 [Corynebacterium sp. H113]|uniref:type II CRISPR-associated endonuclease Cas1 n=1 Tax=Corynebacterium sp. H113 TaxID=3133419 RepID=UPI0030A53EFA